MLIALRHNRHTLDTGRPIGCSLLPNLLCERLLARQRRTKRRWGIGERMKPERAQAEALADANSPNSPIRGHVTYLYRNAPQAALTGGEAGDARARATTVSPEEDQLHEIIVAPNAADHPQGRATWLAPGECATGLERSRQQPWPSCARHL